MFTRFIKKIKSFKSLKVTMAVSFMALSMLILVIAGSLELYFSFQFQRKAIASQQRLIAWDAANTVRVFIQDKFKILNVTSRLGKILTSDAKEQKLFLERLIGFEPGFRLLSLLDSQGRELTRVSRLSNMSRNPLTKEIKDEIIFKIRDNKTYNSQVYIDEITSEPMMLIAVVVTDVFGDFNGALIAELNLKFMWDLVSGIKVGNNGLSYVVDRQGVLIAFRDISRVLKGEKLTILQETREFTFGRGEHKAEVSRGILGSLVVTSFVSLNDPDWAVVVELPVVEAYRPVLNMLILSVWVMFLSFILAIVLGVYLSKRITRPIIALRNAAGEISRGNLNSRIRIEADNEIGELADSFNQMVEGLNSTTVSRDSLIKEVEERKRAEIALQESRQRLADIINFSPDPTFVIDVKGKVIAWNKAIEEMTGIKAKDMLGKGDYEYALPFYGEKRPLLINLVNNLSEDVEKKYPFIKKDKDVLISEVFLPRIKEKGIFVWLKAIPLYDSYGKVVGAIETIRDITERKEAEEELKQAYDKLKNTQAQLVQSAKMASVGILAGGVAHEINNPLTGVLNNVQLIKMIIAQKQDFKISDFLDLLNAIEESAQRCTRITHSLLSFSRASKEVSKEILINEVIDKVLVLIEHEMGLQNISIIKNFESEPPFISGEPQLIQQVVLDLIANAKWAIQKKNLLEGGTITIKTFYDARRDSVCFSVSDTGIGISKENLGNIFEPFFTTKSVGEGTGLGLSIVYNIIKEHKGTIEADSEYGKWTVFTVCFPVTTRKD